MTTRPSTSAAGSGRFALGGDLEVNRLGYGTMQLPGPGVWGEPGDRGGAVSVLRHAVELGVELFDTADSYGPFVAEDLLREALHPYEGLTIATKGGFARTGPGEWYPLGRPEYLRQCVEMSLRRLGVSIIDLYQLHRIDPKVPAEEQVGALADMQAAGKIRHIGLSEVSVGEIIQAREVAQIASVQNLYNVGNRNAEPVLEYCEREGVGFIPWFPLANRELAAPDGRLASVADELDATPSQVALAWLLQRSPVMLPIPGTKSIGHLEENVAAASIELSTEQVSQLDQLT